MSLITATARRTLAALGIHQVEVAGGQRVTLTSAGLRLVHLAARQEALQGQGISRRVLAEVAKRGVVAEGRVFIQPQTFEVHGTPAMFRRLCVYIEHSPITALHNYAMTTGQFAPACTLMSAGQRHEGVFGSAFHGDHVELHLTPAEVEVLNAGRSLIVSGESA